MGRGWICLAITGGGSLGPTAQPNNVCPKCGSSTAYSRAPYGEGYYCYPDRGGCGTRIWDAGSDGVGLLSFTIGGSGNSFLGGRIQAYSHGPYYPKRLNKGDRLSELILKVKNSFEEESLASARQAAGEIASFVANDLGQIADANGPFGGDRPIVVAVPRSKPDFYWKECQLQFREAISTGVKECPLWVAGKQEKWLFDGTHYLTRIQPTMTTHLRKTNRPNEGRAPYPGITRDTCRLEESVAGYPVILVDDIYTSDVGIDEDCAQYLLDMGVTKVVLYTLGKTTRD